MNRAGDEPLVIFGLDEWKFALPISVVERVLRAVEITPLPEAPRGILGVINLRGRIVPVYDLRVRCGLEPRELRSSDFFIVVRTGTRSLALLAEELEDVVPGCDAATAPASDFSPEMEMTAGVMKLPGGVVLVQDVERFLSNDEHESLVTALSVP